MTSKLTYATLFDSPEVLRNRYDDTLDVIQGNPGSGMRNDHQW